MFKILSRDFIKNKFAIKVWDKVYYKHKWNCISDIAKILWYNLYLSCNDRYLVKNVVKEIL